MTFKATAALFVILASLRSSSMLCAQSGEYFTPEQEAKLSLLESHLTPNPVRLVQTVPSTLEWSQEKMQRVATELRHLGIIRVRVFVARNPRIVSMNASKRAEAVVYLQETWGMGIQAIEKYPDVLGHYLLQLKRRTDALSVRQRASLLHIHPSQKLALLMAARADFYHFRETRPMALKQALSGVQQMRCDIWLSMLGLQLN